MVCAYGISDNFGFQSFGDNEETFFMGREMTRNQSYSEEPARRIDAEVASLLDNAYKRAAEMIAENREKLELMVKMLLERETMDGRDVEDLIQLGHVRAPEEREQESLEKEKLEKSEDSAEGDSSETKDAPEIPALQGEESPAGSAEATDLFDMK